MEIDSSIYIE